MVRPKNSPVVAPDTAKPAADVEAALEDRHVGGLGVHFVKKLAERFVYRRDGAVNEISVSRTWVAPSPQAGIL